MIIGIDEVGRGAWAGPVAVGAVMLGEVAIEGLTDSKKLTAKKRQIFAGEIKKHAKQASIGWVSAGTLDRIGMSAALKLAIERALRQLEIKADDQIIIDGTFNFLIDTEYAAQTTTMKQADLLVPSVSAASILAKVARDNYMAKLDHHFADYDFAAHVGYGTKKHQACLKEHGPSPIHRLSFAPLKIQLASAPAEPVATIGQLAEDYAAEYLRRTGYKVVERNWKTKWCEIDIVAEKASCLYFIEVKYRRSVVQGGGLASITRKKQNQMRYAAKFWLHTHKPVYDKARLFQLSALSLSGQPITVERFLESV